MAGGTLVEVDGKSGDKTATLLILAACLPVLFLLVYANLYPDKVNRQFTKSPVELFRTKLEPILLEKGIKWIEVQELLDKVTMEDIMKNLDDPIVVLEKIMDQEGEAAQKLCIAFLKPVLAPVLKRKMGEFV